MPSVCVYLVSECGRLAKSYQININLFSYSYPFQSHSQFTEISHWIKFIVRMPWSLASYISNTFATNDSYSDKFISTFDVGVVVISPLLCFAWQFNTLFSFCSTQTIRSDYYFHFVVRHARICKKNNIWKLNDNNLSSRFSKPPRRQQQLSIAISIRATSSYRCLFTKYRAHLVGFNI